MNNSRVEALIDANIIATHAYQLILAKNAKGMPVDCWDARGMKDKDLQTVVDLQKEMLLTPSSEVVKWTLGKPSKFKAEKHLNRILASGILLPVGLPVYTWVRWLKQKAPAEPVFRLKALASLQQMMLDMVRDGEILQDMYRIYHALSLPVTMGEIGIKSKDNKAFLADGREVSKEMCKAPFPTDVKTLQMQFGKMYNWGRRATGERDMHVLAKELFKESAIKRLLPTLRKLPAQKIAIIGHSFTMNANWSTPSSFIPITIQMMKKINPRVNIRQWQEGGLNAIRAKKIFYPEALKWHPDIVLFVMIAMSKEEKAALVTIVKGFTAAGAKPNIFDHLWPLKLDSSNKTTEKQFKATGLNIINLSQELRASTKRKLFLSLDGIHMTEHWHKVAAKVWLRSLASL